MGPYDIIVVGAGSAGAAAAARLSGDPARHVLLLEAGRDWRPDQAPHALRSANIIPFMNDPAWQAQWQWPALQSRRTAAQQPKFYWRGKALGGSSVVNAQIAIRGTAAAFDAWAEAGCEGWSAASVLPIFDQMEDDPEAGRTGGPIPIYRAPPETWGPVDKALRDAALANGYPWNPDLNAAPGQGVSCYPINSRDGRRVSTNDAYLEPARTRPNLTVQGGSLVDRILISNGQVTGARVRLSNQWQDIPARQVLLCAGAIHSPAILLRSGLGPAEDLKRLGIPVTANLPHVGANFIDHPFIRATLRLRPEFISRDPDQRHTNCCVTYTSGLGGAGARDMILIGFNHRLLGDNGMPATSGAIGAGIYEAFSRGSVRLTSSDPDIDPAVEENMLSDHRDRQRLRDAVRRLAILTAHPAITSITETITFAETSLTLAQAAALPAADLDTILLEQAADGQHAAGTCRMSAWEDPRGVVNPDLTVKGIAGLRVADASVMPMDCRANTHLTCVMIGLMAATRIAAAETT